MARRTTWRDRASRRRLGLRLRAAPFTGRSCATRASSRRIRERRVRPGQAEVHERRAIIEARGGLRRGDVCVDLAHRCLRGERGTYEDGGDHTEQHSCEAHISGLLG